jgi:hypothetical protein
MRPLRVRVYGTVALAVLFAAGVRSQDHTLDSAGLASLMEVRAEQVPNFSGTWERLPLSEGFVLVRHTLGNNPTGGSTWGQVAEAIRASSPYSVRIIQTATDIDIAFPVSSGPMTQNPYVLDGTEHATVKDSQRFRGMWTKFIAKATWQGPALAVQGTNFSGFYSNADPSAVLKEPDHSPPGARNPTVFHHLILDPRTSRLTITSTLGDEKGEVLFKQIFAKAR